MTLDPFRADDGFAGELVLLRAGPAEVPDHPVIGEQLGLGITVPLVGGADVLGEDVLDGVLCRSLMLPVPV